MQTGPRKEWLLTICILKIYIIHSGLNNPNHAYTVYSVAIASIFSIKDLGAYVSNTLPRRKYIFEITKTAIYSRVVNVIVNAFNSHA